MNASIFLKKHPLFLTWLFSCLWILFVFYPSCFVALLLFLNLVCLRGFFRSLALQLSFVALCLGVQVFRGSPQIGSPKSTREVLTPLSQEWKSKRESVPKRTRDHQESVTSRIQRAVLFGDQASIYSKEWKAFNYLGLSHLLVISGFHIGLLFLGLSFLIQALVRQSEVFVSAGRHNLIKFIIFALLLSFVKLGLPAWRATLVLSIYIGMHFISPQIGRYRKSELIAFMGFLFLLMNPLSLFSKSYCLSFGISWAICASFEKRGNRNNSLLLSCLVAYLVSIGTASVFLMDIHLLSPLLNFVALPIFTFVIVPLLVISIPIPRLEVWLDTLFSNLLDFIQSLAEFLMSHSLSINFSPQWGSLVLITLGLLIIFEIPTMRRVLLIYLVVIGLGFVESLNTEDVNNFRITNIDVGQGDSLLLELEGKKILIDGGKGVALEEYRKRNLIHKIDLWVISHFDQDHSQAFFEAWKNWSPQEVWISGYGNGNERRFFEKLESQTKVESQNWNRCEDRLCVAAWTAASKDSFKIKNPESLVFYVYNRVSKRIYFISTGDLPKPKEMDFIGFLKAKGLNLLVPVEVLKLGHHGSKSSSGSQFLDEIRPRVAIILSGRMNQYHFPHDSVLNRLAERGISVLRIDSLGTNHIDFKFE